MPLSKNDIIAEIGERNILPASETGDVELALWIRVSSPPQVQNGQLTKQRDRVYAAATKLGITPRKEFICQESARCTEKREEFRKALRWCRKKGVALLAEEATRFIRAEAGEYEEPRLMEFLEMWRLVKEVPLFTVIDPGLSVRDLHSEKTRLGMNASTKKPGRKPILSWDMVTKTLKLREIDTGTGQLGIGGICKALNESGFAISRRQVQNALNLEFIDPRGQKRRLMDYELLPSAYDAFRKLWRDDPTNALFACLVDVPKRSK